MGVEDGRVCVEIGGSVEKWPRGGGGYLLGVALDCDFRGLVN